METVHSEGSKDDTAIKLNNFRKDLKWYRRNCPTQICEIVRLSDNPEMYQEVSRYKQAKIGRLLNFQTVKRLETRQFFYKEYYPEWTVASRPKKGEQNYAEKSPTQPPPVSYYKQDLQLETQNSEIPKLADVALRYCVGEQEKKTGSGTLEAHVNGFRYTISSPTMQIDFSYKNVKHALFRSEDEDMPPLLHFNLHVPINVEGTVEANDIQFQLVKTLVGKKRSADDILGMIEKGNKDYNEDFRKFVKKVQAKWNPHLLPFELPHKKNEFRGSSGVFALTTFCLAGIVRTPFFVVALSEIEFVNLAHLRDGEIDMTIVLKDFTREVFQIKSIPSEFVAVIKKWFDIFCVKYYENRQEPDWNAILHNIRENPQDFIDKGCWQYLKLESGAAAALSSDSDKSSESESESDFEEEEPLWNKFFAMRRSGSDIAEEKSE